MWILDNLKPIGRLQRGEYCLRVLFLGVQLAFWLFNVVASGISAAASGPEYASMRHTFYLVLSFGLLIAWQSFTLMLRRLQDIGVNPIFAVAGYTIFLVLEFVYFSSIPDLATNIAGVPLPVSWLGVSVPLFCGVALMLLPSAPEGIGSVASDGSSTGSNWADAVKIPTAQSAPAAYSGVERRAEPRKPNPTGQVKPQFGNRPARQR